MEANPVDNPENEREKLKLTFEEQFALAKELSDAVDIRNNYIKRFGSFDDFAEIHQYVGNNRLVYDEMEDDVSKAREKFDRDVIDKEVFVNKLRESGKNQLALRISQMFGLKAGLQNSLLSRIFGRKKK
ncbi:MAG: hypothetical protein Q7S34_00725 [bacterium]|nr:hypothetical protein [bacterium]